MMIQGLLLSEVWQCVLQRLLLQPLVCHRVRTAQRVKDAEGTAKPQVLDTLGRACYLPAESLGVADSKILQELDSVDPDFCG